MINALIKTFLNWINVTLVLCIKKLVLKVLSDFAFAKSDFLDLVNFSIFLVFDRF